MRTPQLSDPLQSASILPDLHPCRRSSQEKADPLNCSWPNPKHNTGWKQFDCVLAGAESTEASLPENPGPTWSWELEGVDGGGFPKRRRWVSTTRRRGKPWGAPRVEGDPCPVCSSWDGPDLKSISWDGEDLKSISWDGEEDLKSISKFFHRLIAFIAFMSIICFRSSSHHMTKWSQSWKGSNDVQFASKWTRLIKFQIESAHF